jgi:hypothetical protein
MPGRNTVGLEHFLSFPPCQYFKKMGIRNSALTFPNRGLAGPFQFNCDRIRPIHTLQFDLIRPAPFDREAAAKLEHEDVGKGIVVEKATHPGRVMAAEFKLLPRFVPGVAMTLDALNGPDDAIADSLNFSHDRTSFGMSIGGNLFEFWVLWNCFDP